MYVGTRADHPANSDGYEIRTLGEVRVDLSEDRRIRGHAIVFNKRSVNLGWFVEIMKPESVDRTLREALDVRALVDHEMAKVLGRTKSGTLDLKKDREGLKFAIDPPNTSYAKDIMEVIDRGDVSGMSFRFRTMPDGDEWEEEEETGILIRYVTDIIIDEISIVTFPAYPDTDVEVAKRSLQAFHAKQGNSRVDQLRRQLRNTLAQ